MILFFLLIISVNHTNQINQYINKETSSINPHLINNTLKQIEINRFNLNTNHCEQVFKFNLAESASSLDSLYFNDDISHITPSDTNSPVQTQLLLVRKLNQLYLITFEKSQSHYDNSTHDEQLIKVNRVFICPEYKRV
jgi:hypothetical protein